MKRIKKKNWKSKEYEITLIKTDQDLYEHYYNYRKQIGFRDLLRIAKNFKASGFQVQIEGPTSSARFGFLKEV